MPIIPGNKSKPDYQIEPLLSYLPVYSRYLYKEERKEGGHDKLPHALDPQVYDPPPEILIENHIGGFKEGEEVEYRKPKKAYKEHYGDTGPSPALYYGHKHIKDKHQEQRQQWRL